MSFHSEYCQTGQTQYKKGYPWTTQEAREGNLCVVGYYKDGFKLKNNRTGDIAMWFKRKKDALKKINDLANCPNTPREENQCK